MTVMRRQRWADMSEDARDRLCARGLDDIFDPALRASIGELIDDVRERGDAAVCDALARHDGVVVEPDGLRITDDELDAFVDRLARRIAGFPPHAVAAAKASVVRAEPGVTEQLLAEGDAFAATLTDPASHRAMTAFLARGGQTPDGERRLGTLAGELSS